MCVCVYCTVHTHTRTVHTHTHTHTNAQVPISDHVLGKLQKKIAWCVQGKHTSIYYLPMQLHCACCCSSCTARTICHMVCAYSIYPFLFYLCATQSFHMFMLSAARTEGLRCRNYFVQLNKRRHGGAINGRRVTSACLKYTEVLIVSAFQCQSTRLVIADGPVGKCFELDLHCLQQP